jgi:transcriptional regulator with XRE-family HTH domain
MSSNRGPRINRHAVRAIRIAQGKSQVKLAALSGLDHSYLSRIESGQRCHPAPDVTLRIAKALDVEMAALLADPGVLTP